MYQWRGTPPLGVYLVVNFSQALLIPHRPYIAYPARRFPLTSTAGWGVAPPGSQGLSNNMQDQAVLLWLIWRSLSSFFVSHFSSEKNTKTDACLPYFVNLFYILAMPRICTYVVLKTKESIENKRKFNVARNEMSRCRKNANCVCKSLKSTLCVGCADQNDCVLVTKTLCFQPIFIKHASLVFCMRSGALITARTRVPQLHSPLTFLSVFPSVLEQRDFL